jgi:diaminohydroxyphosphoribosylaminopyrimidine deaminase/5-amino-6-(5-phosphoribosylamino)uracil reductase
MNAGVPAQHMAHALRLAERGRWTTFPNPRVGCVIVRDGRVVGEGWHERAGEPHAEVHALKTAAEQVRGAEMFVTLEPCSHHGRTPPCADAIIASGIRKVWAAMQDPNPRVAGQGIERLHAAGIDVQLGLMESAAHALNRGFVSRMSRGRPFVTLKLGMSLDGRTAMATGESQWITGEAARADVHRLRAEAGAVLTSSATVLADDPQLNVRHLECPRQPDRIVLDARGRVSDSARVWNQDGARRFRLGKRASAGETRDGGPLFIEGVELPDGRLDLHDVMAALAAHEINSVLVECGPVLAGSLLQAGLVDELVCYVAPQLLGDTARGLARIPALQRLDQRVQLTFTDVRQIGADLRITAVPAQRTN